MRIRSAPEFPVGIMLIALFTLTLCGCHFNFQVYPETIVNDTSETVIVRHCDDYCGSATLTFTLAPGQTANDNVEGGVATWFSVTNPNGDHLGCLNLGVAPQAGEQVMVSTAGPCL